MDPDIALRFRGYLTPRETIRWTGRPVQGFAFQHGDLITVPFGAVWMLFVWMLFFDASRKDAFDFFVGAIFLAIGFNFVFGRYLTDAYVRTRTYYALSDERALIMSGWDGRAFTAVELAGVSEINVIPSGDRGTIAFGPTNDTNLVWKGRTERSRSPEFFKIEQAQSVYALIQTRRRTS